jgi:exopolysaccharide biosynthesis polyprenyl glycosylphosphotransferase
VRRRIPLVLSRLEVVCLALAAVTAGLVWIAPGAYTSLAAFVAVLFPARAVLRWWRASEWEMERVLVVGTGPLAARVVAALEQRPRQAFILGVLDDGERAAGRWRYPILGRAHQIHRTVRRTRPHRIIVASESARLPLRQLLRQRLRGVRVEDGVAAYERLTGKVPIEALSPGALLFSENLGSSPLDGLASRLLTVVAALAALVVVLPLGCLIALAIKLDSRGPVFFVQRRLGLGGRCFDLVKFRTMHVAHVVTSEWVRDNRHRITRLGETLRRFRLDELPQVWNMLRGDMNLVGPRPHPVANARLFAQRIPFYWLRARVRPGLTGWAQVHYGYANNLDEETEKMRYDLYYIKHRSIWLDLAIIPATVRAVFQGGGAAEARAPAPVVPLRSAAIRPATAGVVARPRRSAFPRPPAERPAQRSAESPE